METICYSRASSVTIQLTKISDFSTKFLNKIDSKTRFNILSPQIVHL